MPPNIPDLEIVFSSLLSIILATTGVASFIMLIMAGYRLMLAGGDKDAIQKAQNTLVYALFGVGISILSWVIINMVGKFLGLNLSQFTLCLPGYTISSTIGGGCQ